MFFILIVPILLMVFTLIIMIRNGKVFDWRMEKLNEVSSLAKQDIDQGFSWIWRYDELSSAPYASMVWKFWKPMESFYDNLDFLNPEVVRKY